MRREDRVAPPQYLYCACASHSPVHLFYSPCLTPFRFSVLRFFLVRWQMAAGMDPRFASGGGMMGGGGGGFGGQQMPAGMAGLMQGMGNPMMASQAAQASGMTLMEQNRLMMHGFGQHPQSGTSMCNLHAGLIR